MPNQDYTNPGAAVADTLQDILTRRTAEKRQGFLDQLNQQNLQHDWDYKDQQAQSLADDRVSQGLQRAQQTKLFGEEETDKATARTRTAAQDATLNAILTSKEFAGLPPVNQMAVRAMIAQGKAPSAADFTTAPKSTMGHVYNLDEATKKLTDAATGQPVAPNFQFDPAVDRIEHISRPPAGPAGDEPQIFQIPDPKGGINATTGQANTISIMARPSALLNSQPGHLANTPGVRVFGGDVRKGNEPTPPQRKPISAGSAGAFQKLTSLLATGNDPMDAGVVAARAQAISSLVDPVFKQDVSHYVQRRESGVPVTADYVHQTLQAPPGMDAQQYENAVTTMLHGSGIF